MSSSCVDLSGRMRLLHAMSEEAADEADDSELDALTLLRRPTGQRRHGLSSKTYLSGSLLMPLSEIEVPHAFHQAIVDS